MAMFTTGWAGITPSSGSAGRRHRSGRLGAQPSMLSTEARTMIAESARRLGDSKLTRAQSPLSFLQSSNILSSILRHSPGSNRATARAPTSGSRAPSSLRSPTERNSPPSPGMRLGPMSGTVVESLNRSALGVTPAVGRSCQMLTLSRAMLEGVPTGALGVEAAAPAGAGIVVSKAAMTLSASTEVSTLERIARMRRRSRRQMFIAHLPCDRDRPIFRKFVPST